MTDHETRRENRASILFLVILMLLVALSLAHANLCALDLPLGEDDDALMDAPIRALLDAFDPLEKAIEDVRTAHKPKERWQ